jgi:hypothetical protein
MKPKGFAWMKIHHPARLRTISRIGGTVSQAEGKGARPWTREEAKAHAAAGGRARWRGKKTSEGGAT